MVTREELKASISASGNANGNNISNNVNISDNANSNIASNNVVGNDALNVADPELLVVGVGNADAEPVGVRNGALNAAAAEPAPFMWGTGSLLASLPQLQLPSPASSSASPPPPLPLLFHQLLSARLSARLGALKL